MVTAERRRVIEDLSRAIARWAASRSDVRAVAVVGSWARGEPTMDSDLDVVVLSDELEQYLGGDDWVESAAGERATVIRRRRWGALLTERRVLLDSGLEVEFGFAPLSWASTKPLDPGTEFVVRDGCRPLVDPDGVIEKLRAAVS